MSKVLYKGKDIENMDRSELIICVKELFQKLKDKHHIILGLKMQARMPEDTRAEQFADAFLEALKGKK